ncbi:MAG: hypothetical protein AAF683_04570 [Pseudomonadota bacterium]
MLAFAIVGVFLLIASGFAFGVPMMVFGPRIVFARLSHRQDGRMMLGGVATLVIAFTLAPFAVDPLISAGEIAHISAENFNRLSWRI